VKTLYIIDVVHIIIRLATDDLSCWACYISLHL